MAGDPVRVRTRYVGSISTTRIRKRFGVAQDEVSNTDIIPAPEDLRNPSYVAVKAGITRNLGDFNGCQVSVSISMPCRATPDEIEKTYQEVSGIVSKLLDSEYDKAIEKAEGATDHEPASAL